VPEEEDQQQQAAAIDFSPAVEPRSFDPTPLLADPPEPFAQAVSRILASAVDDILKLHQARVMDAFDSRLQVLVQGVRKEVHATLEAELGGPLQPPPKPPEPPTAPEPTPSYALPGVLPVKRLSVDVVGFIGSQCEEVRRAVNGDVDVRFIDAKHARSPGQHFRPNVIVALQFVDRGATDRIRKQVKRFIPIRGNASQAIAAIEQLLAEQGGAHVH
jgi:hypothetical protein